MVEMQLLSINIDAKIETQSVSNLSEVTHQEVSESNVECTSLLLYSLFL